jgi:hypothetical protein
MGCIGETNKIPSFSVAVLLLKLGHAVSFFFFKLQWLYFSNDKNVCQSLNVNYLKNDRASKNKNLIFLFKKPSAARGGIKSCA